LIWLIDAVQLVGGLDADGDAGKARLGDRRIIADGADCRQMDFIIDARVGRIDRDPAEADSVLPARDREADVLAQRGLGLVSDIDARVRKAAGGDI
jgi:hypothetical protein